MSYLEKKRNLYYAILKIPSDLREHFGKTKFSKSTGQADPRKARSIALGFVSEWQKQIQAARKLALDADLQMALEMRRDIEAAIESGEDDPGVAYGISDFIDKLRETGQKERAEKFACVVFGKEVVLAEYYEAWVVSIKTTSQRTRIEYSNIGREVLKMFPTVSAITPKAVRAWARMMLDGNGNYDAPLSKSSIEKRFKVARNLWQYLEYHELVDQEANPFRLPRFVSEADKKLRAERLKTKGRAEERLPFEPYELVEIWRNASQSDPQLADLIFLAMYTGCRIEELCRLKVRECTNSLLKVTSSKTKAGYRDIPVHPKLKPLVQRLLDESTDGYLMSGLSAPKSSGERSSAIGKRFGRLKKRLGFDESKVFHSIRKTVATLLENANVPENLAAEIVGHEHGSLTYGLYSGGYSYDEKLNAISKIEYPLVD